MIIIMKIITIIIIIIIIIIMTITFQRTTNVGILRKMSIRYLQNIPFKPAGEGKRQIYLVP